MLKNTSGQKIGAQMVDLDGAAFAGSVTVYVCGDAGTQAAGSVGSGACTHEGNGYHTYAPSQAETNYDLIAFTFVGTNAVSVTVQVSTDTNTLLTSTGIKVASIANGAIAAATFAAGALDAVWSVTSRTLTEISDSAGITTLLSRIASALTIDGGKVTVGTNDDKNGYALATTPPTAAQIRIEMDANSTKLANLDATISSRLASADYSDVDLSAVLTAIAALHDFDPATDTVAHVTLVDTTTTLTNAPDVPTEAEIAAEVLASAVESGQTVKQALRLMLSALAGKLSGAAGTSITIRNTDDTKDRIVATVDADGNRTAVTYDTSD